MLPHEIPDMHAKTVEALQSPAIDRTRVLLSLLYERKITEALGARSYDASERMKEVAGKFLGDRRKVVRGPILWGTIITETQIIQFDTDVGGLFTKPQDHKCNVSAFQIGMVEGFNIIDWQSGWYKVEINFNNRAQTSFVAHSPQHNEAIEIIKKRKEALLDQAPMSNSPSQRTVPDIGDQLLKLSELRRAGVLTDEEFEAAKRKLLI